jgi:flagellar biosynthesis activator protein FlaF
MLAAARLNWRLWTIIQSELLDPASTVPLEVRTNVLSLSRFVDATTVDFVAEPLAAKLDSLIAINRELASGLYANPSPAEPVGAVGASGGGDSRTTTHRPDATAIRLSI